MQFEECWMSLLIALNSLPEYESSDEEMVATSQVRANRRCKIDFFTAQRRTFSCICSISEH